MTWEDEFISDLQTKSSKDCLKKYSNKVPKHITIRGLISNAKIRNVLSAFIDVAYFGDKRDVKTTFLMMTGSGKFEVFITDRGEKHWLTTYDDLESAVFGKLDLILNEFEFTSKDSEISRV